MSKRPGGEISSRPLHFIWIADYSGSMGEAGKIQALNQAIREAIPAIKQEADENPTATVLIRAVKFADGAQWHIANPTPIDQFKWIDLNTDGATDMGAAFSLVAEQLKMPPMPARALPPVLILISDGQPTDDYKKGLNELNSLPWGKKAVRMAIAIGRDANLDVLREFINNPEIKPLQANNPEALAHFIKWASTNAVKVASSPASQPVKSSNQTKGNIPIPSAPPANNISTDDVW